MALVPALTDFTFVEEKKGKLFVNTPNALKAITFPNVTHPLPDSRAKRQVL